MSFPTVQSSKHEYGNLIKRILAALCSKGCRLAGRFVGPFWLAHLKVGLDVSRSMCQGWAWTSIQRQIISSVSIQLLGDIAGMGWSLLKEDGYGCHF